MTLSMAVDYDASYVEIDYYGVNGAGKQQRFSLTPESYSHPASANCRFPLLSNGLAFAKAGRLRLYFSAAVDGADCSKYVISGTYGKHAFSKGKYTVGKDKI